MLDMPNIDKIMKDIEDYLLQVKNGQVKDLSFRVNIRFEEGELQLKSIETMVVHQRHFKKDAFFLFKKASKNDASLFKNLTIEDYSKRIPMLAKKFLA